jgi:hypothetical protein
MKDVIIILFLLITLNSKAQITFEKLFGDIIECSGIGVLQTSDDGYLIIAEKTTNNPADYKLFIIKTNEYGDTSWTKTYPIDSGKIWKGILTSDNGIVFTGNKGHFLYLFKINNVGDTLWTREIAFNNKASGRSIVEMDNSGFLIAGEDFIGNFACCTPILIKTDFEGNLNKTIDLPVLYGRAYDLIKTNDNNFVVSYSSITGYPVPFLAKVNEDGNFLWIKDYNKSAECNVSLTSNNGFILSGINSFSQKPYIIKIDSNGFIEWNKFNSELSLYNYNLKLSQTLDNGYIMTGGLYNSPSELILFKISYSGDSLWKRTFTGYGNSFGNSVIITRDGGIATVGYSINPNTQLKEIFFIKTNRKGFLTSIKQDINDNIKITVNPNPIVDNLNIASEIELKDAVLSIYNSIGTKIFSDSFIKEKHINFPYPKGLYVIRISNIHNTFSIKVVKN